MSGTGESPAAIHGHCDPAFAPVAAKFAANFQHRRELGAALCITHRGRVVLDLWGGIANHRTDAPWEEDTLCVVFSCTKGATALAAHMLAERGALSLHDPVDVLWPGFAANGKDGTTLAHMLGHTAPVPHLRDPIKPGGMAEYDYMVDRVAAEPAWWPSGSRQGYHGLTFAWTVGHMVRLAAGRPLSRFFAEEIAGPLNLDFHIGLPEEHESRVARLAGAEPSEIDTNSRYWRAVRGEPGSLPNLFATNSGGADFNTRHMHEAELGSANGISNARGLAGLYRPLANGGEGLVSPDTIARMSRTIAATHDDATLRQPLRFGLGFMTSMDNRVAGGDSLIIGERAFGHCGVGGSLGFADPEAALSFGYVMNRMGGPILLNGRGQSLVDATYRALGYTSSDSGAWRR